MSDEQRKNGVFGSSGASRPSMGAAPGGRPKSRSRRRGRGRHEGEHAGEDAERREKKRGFKECRAKMLQLLAMRDYSTAKMREKLVRAGFSEADAEKAIKSALDARLMDDARFGVYYISAKQEAGWGRRKIEHGLEGQGIDPSSLPGYPDAYVGEDGELARAIRCARGHRSSSKNPRESHYRYLISKGFAPTICARALRFLQDEEAAEGYDEIACENA